MGRIIAGLLLALAFADGARADGLCSSNGASTVSELDFHDAGSDTLKGLTIALALGLDPPSFPFEAVTASSAPCTLGAFRVGADSYSLYSSDEAPQRWAVSKADVSHIAFLVQVPQPVPALNAIKANPDAISVGFSMSELMFVLAVTEGDTRGIYRFYDAIPDDARLEHDMCMALSGQTTALASFDPFTNKGDFAGLAARASAHAAPNPPC
jgi:hypothetical protein